MNLSGKIAIITGGNSGIGHAILMKFAECGADIAFVDIVVDCTVVASYRLFVADVVAVGFGSFYSDS